MHAKQNYLKLGTDRIHRQESFPELVISKCTHGTTISKSRQNLWHIIGTTRTTMNSPVAPLGHTPYAMKVTRPSTPATPCACRMQLNHPSFASCTHPGKGLSSRAFGTRCSSPFSPLPSALRASQTSPHDPPLSSPSTCAKLFAPTKPRQYHFPRSHRGTSWHVPPVTSDQTLKSMLYARDISTSLPGTNMGGKPEPPRARRTNGTYVPNELGRPPLRVGARRAPK